MHLHPQFPNYDWLVAAWLLLNVAMQGAFAIFAALNQTKHMPDVAIRIIAGMLLALAPLKAHRSPDALNEVIFSGLPARVLL